jgi:hypothetical protein
MSMHTIKIIQVVSLSICVAAATFSLMIFVFLNGHYLAVIVMAAAGVVPIIMLRKWERAEYVMCIMAVCGLMGSLLNVANYRNCSSNQGKCVIDPASARFIALSAGFVACFIFGILGRRWIVLRRKRRDERGL